VFSFLYSEQKKMRQNAENWLEVADRVYKYRRDQLSEAQTVRLLAAAGEVKLRLKEKADASRIKMSVESLEGVLRDTGGRIYPVSSIVENVEFFLVAAIVILGLRAYFVQPFKIPTNSMWPSYYGMTASEVYKDGEEPGVLKRALRMARLGASHYSVAAPTDGEISLPVFSTNYGLRLAFTEKSGRSLLIFPTMLREYTFSVAGELTRISIPSEFDNDFQGVLDSAFKGDAPNLYSLLAESAARNKPLRTSTIQYEGREATVYWIPIGRKVHQGEKFLSFDILTGDLLFVDRLSYNFIPPKVGSGFVFRTGHIEDLMKEDGTEKYFIKRLVGVPGDTLEIRKPGKIAADGNSTTDGREGLLYRNGKPIDGAEAFQKNARKEGLYPGYEANGLLSFGDTLEIPAKSYFAMGDNSPRSKDSRFWGFVPEKDVVGRPLFIYYPLTSRWGPAR